MAFIHFRRLDRLEFLWLGAHRCVWHSSLEQSMRYLHSWSDPERWDWFAAGETDAARQVGHSSRSEYSAQRLLFEIGLILLIPLTLAALIEIIFAA